MKRTFPTICFSFYLALSLIYNTVFSQTASWNYGTNLITATPTATNVVIGGGAPLILQGSGTGTYTRSVIYNNTTDNFLIDLARLSENSSGTPINFRIDARGGGKNFFTITGSSGNVGIGTPTPSGLFHVERLYGGNHYAYFNNNCGSTNPNYTAGLAIGWNKSGGEGEVNLVANKGSGSIGGFKFQNWNGTTLVDLIKITAGGNLLVNKPSQLNSNYKIDVDGTVRASEVVVNTNGADFVFDENYSLASLDEVDKFIKKNNHLPGIPSAEQMQKEGISVGEMQSKLLQKIEELTLYIIEQHRKIIELENINK